MLNQMVDITENNNQFEKILAALPNVSLKNNYVKGMQDKHLIDDHEWNGQLTSFVQTKSATRLFSVNKVLMCIGYDMSNNYPFLS